ncbi:MAG: 3-oxoacyl-[acyl-carrier-protein] synthase 2 [Chlamydiales bacterium]|nr:3-oxoacyl-[acyl-carrier-protein] synthase 2 [Chlamydiales bacterium]MCH9619880.1 3-oxoacyl-[acyl-carrier-protein] synthase 2 [Chlamydiales bacterium]MCH9622693.1 3-oxoacyl-[acyl-carrier-protein] synthase 2 [Chlamydiales bacterium]
MDKKKRIVVTGMGVVSCFGNDVDTFYNTLLEGKSGVTTLDFALDEYPTRIGAPVPDFDVGDYLDKKLNRRVDPCIRFALVAGKKALENANLYDKLDTLDKDRCGIIIGSGMGGLSTFYEGTKALITQGHRRLSPFFIPFIITNMAGGLLAIDVGFKGPNYSISTACATGNYSIAAAANHIRMGHADLMVCGGAEAAVSPIGLVGFIANKALSTRNDEPAKACRPWDRGRDGFVIGEGAGTLILESLEHAEKRGAPILAEYLGGAINCDAYHMTAPHAEGIGISDCIELALKDAGVNKSEVNYVNAHATSTPMGDMSEPRALSTVFGKDVSKLKMNSTKSMIGHALGAAGGIEAIATIMAIRTGKLHPTINSDDPEPDLNGIDIVPNKAQDYKVNVALSNSFGFGGHNSVLVFKAFE